MVQTYEYSVGLDLLSQAERKCVVFKCVFECFFFFFVRVVSDLCNEFLWHIVEELRARAFLERNTDMICKNFC